MDPIVFGMRLVQADHMRIAMGFRQDGGGGNAGVSGVSLDDTAMGYAGVRVKAVSVYEQEFRLLYQGCYGLVHGINGGV